jgi:hypothetical protein
VNTDSYLYKEFDAVTWKMIEPKVNEKEFDQKGYLRVTRIPRHVIIKNNLFSQDKCTIIISPTQMMKNDITMANCAKYEQKTSQYLPLFLYKCPALYFQLENIRVLASLVFTHWVKEKVVEFI